MKHADLIMGYSCNLNCIFCLGEEGNRGRDYPYDMLRSSLINLRSEGYVSVCFNGGEPTMRKSLIKLVKLARHLGFERIKIQTNALIVDSALLELGVKFGVTVYSLKKEAYEGAVKAEMHELFIKNLLKIPEPEIDIIISRENLGEIEEMIGRLKHASSINLKYPCLGGSALANSRRLAMKYEDVRIPKGVSSVQYMPLCMLKDPSKARVPDLTIIDGESRFTFSESLQRSHIKVSGCAGCRHKDRCFGIDQNYVRLFGEPEVMPPA
jgi:organic radical activating enzyme